METELRNEPSSVAHKPNLLGRGHWFWEGSFCFLTEDALESLAVLTSLGDFGRFWFQGDLEGECLRAELLRLRSLTG